LHFASSNISSLVYSKFSKNTLAITNVVGSTISRESKSVIYTRAGIEIGVASTKTFIAQIMVLLLLSIRWSNNRFIVKKDLFSIPIKIDEILNQLNSIKKIAFKLKDYKSLLVMGRYLSFPIALECALKIKELSYIHAEGYASGEMKHGPIALLDDNYPVIFFCPNDSIAIKSLSNSQEILARKGKLFFITSEDFKNNTVNPVFKLPKTSNYVYPILSAVFLQLLSYEIALQKKLNVDQPRNLAKSVTVE
jgi:glucosamine--fructose-6-phosphate aminotransferase (isomerizing)